MKQCKKNLAKFISARGAKQTKQFMMGVVPVIDALEELLNKWGISNKNWVLAARYALRILGYKVKVRRGHLNIFVNKTKIPWKTKEELQTHPPVNTNMADDFFRFMKKTGFDFDIRPKATVKFQKVIEKSILYSLPSKKQIYVHTPMGMLDELDQLLSMCTDEGLGEEKGTRTLLFMQDQEKVFREKGEIEYANAYRELIIKYSHSKILQIRPENRTDMSKDRLYGTPASKGRAKGKAAVVLQVSSSKKFRKGDILITSVVSPKLTPVILKAAAVVTDEGGILCHAAIISRELGIPCVVGVRSATKIFKDGEKVAVNAYNGIIYKVKN